MQNLNQFIIWRGLLLLTAFWMRLSGRQRKCNKSFCKYENFMHQFIWKDNIFWKVLSYGVIFLLVSDQEKLGDDGCSPKAPLAVRSKRMGVSKEKVFTTPMKNLGQGKIVEIKFFLLCLAIVLESQTINCILKDWSNWQS